MSVSRRSLLLGGVLGAAAAVLGTSLALLAGERSRAGRPLAAGPPVHQARSYYFSQRWLFGGRYVAGAEQPGYDDGGFEAITLPHTVTSLSWDDWDYASWEDVWIYRKHFAGAAVAGARVLVTFDGVMTNAIVVVNGWTAGAHAGGYLPWTTELTGYAGLLAWAGFDYYAAATRNRRNWNTLRTPGVVDTFRVPKPGAAIYQSQIDPATRPVIVPVFFWDSASAPAGPGPVSMIATNCDRLEIFVGGAHLTTATPDRQRFGYLAYPPAFADLTMHGGSLPDLRVDGYVGTTLAAGLLMSADATLGSASVQITVTARSASYL
jgi:hypothetical protein